MPTHVDLDWKLFSFSYKDTWKKTSENLTIAEVDEKLLKRSVYIIRSKDFCIDYPRGESPVLYIGKGNFKTRFEAHRRDWLAGISDSLPVFLLEAYLCCPRVRNNVTAHNVLEARLLCVFRDRFGSLPLNNVNIETCNYDHEYKQSDINMVLGIGAGRKIKWTIRPREPNPLFDNYQRTHVED